MPLESTPPLSVIGILCATMERIESSGEVDARDPAFAELKRSIARAIAEFEVAKSSRSEAALEASLLEAARSAPATAPQKDS
jgi:hypothetical protein